jgi:hypothetical protein
MNLRLDWCSYDAAKYAVMNWHYSKTMPVGKLVKIGVWEDDKFIGVVIFGRGANKSLGSQFGLNQMQSCELVRIALNKHKTSVSRIIKFSLAFLKRLSPNIKLIVSFADKEQGHVGGIYQAGNWVYNGETSAADEYLYKERRWHGRAFRKSKGSHLKYIDKGLKIVKGSTKHRYLYPLDKEIREQIKPLAKPYPKKNCDSGVKRSTASFQDVGGGAIPTESLQLERQYA